MSQALGALRAVFRNENLRAVELAWGASIAAEWARRGALDLSRGLASAAADDYRTADEYARDRGAYRLNKPISTIKIPDRVQSVRAARIDRLPEERKSFLQAGAVIGKDLPFSLLQAVAGVPAEELLGNLAESLLQRYLRDHGEYPRSVGLSVWGTSAMRTSGDDIAEVFALLGVRPVWDEMSRRVARLEARKATGAGNWLVEVPSGATEAEVAAAISAHRAGTGWTGGIVLTRPTLTIEGTDSAGNARTWLVRLWNYATGTPTSADAASFATSTTRRRGWKSSVGRIVP